MRKICDYLVKYSLYLLVFLIPLFWLPWSSEGYEFSKQYLLIFLIGLAFLGRLIKMIALRKKVAFRRTPLDVWILALMLIMILSAIFSIDSISSWLGYYGRFTQATIAFLAVLVLYFILVNKVKISLKQEAPVEKFGNQAEKSKGFFKKFNNKNSSVYLSSIFNLFTAASFIVVIVSLFSFYGILAKLTWLPQEIKGSFFNMTGASVQGLTIYLAVLISFLVGDLISLHRRKVKQDKKKKLGSWLKSILLALSAYLLIITNFWPAWMIIGIAMLFLLVMAFWTRLFKERVNLLMLPIFFLLISSFFVFNFPGKAGILNNLNFLNRNVPQELMLSYDLTRQISWQAVKEYPVLGSGPGTFLHDFAKFKPAEFNQGQFWNVRFDKSSSHIMELAATIGILGVLSYLLIIFIFLLIMSLSLQRLRKLSQDNSENQDKREKAVSILPLFLGWLALALGQFFYLQNTTLLFLFWLFTALGIVAWQQMESKAIQKISFSFKKMPEVGLVVNVVLLIIIFALAGLFYLGGQFYAAEAKFVQPIKDNQAWVKKMESVVNLNPYREIYRRGLSQAYLSSAWQEANKEEDKRNAQLLQNLTAGAVQQARTAVQLAPNSVLAWQNLGNVYQDSRGLIGGVIPFALEAYAKASELEPNNPVFYRERCRLNLLNEDRDWDKTVQFCKKAVELKKNYLDAQIQLALVFEEKGELKEAVKEMEKVLTNLRGVSFQRGSELASAATEIYFQMGRLQFNLKDYEKAIKMFEQAVVITPNYPNARYALGLAYQSVGRTEDALGQYRIIAQLLPDNQEIKKLIQQLEGAQAQTQEAEEAAGVDSN